MEFVIKQSVLKEVLGFVQGVVERKSTIPVLSNILIESLGENSIRVVGTDLDVTIRCDAEAEIKKGGAMCVQARKLFDLSRLLTGENVAFKRRPRAVRNQGNAMLVAHLGDVRHVFGGLREHHGVRQHGRIRRFVAAVMLANGGRLRQAVAKVRAQRIQTSGRHRAAQRIGVQGSVHDLVVSRVR